MNGDDIIMSGSSDTTIKVWDKATGACLQTLKGHNREIKSLVVDGDRFASSSYGRIFVHERHWTLQ